MTRGTRPLIVAAVVAVSVAAAAFALASPREAASAQVLPGCAHARQAVVLPAALQGFPLPAGTVLDSRTSKYGYAIVTGYLPGAINPIRDYFVSRVPASGYRLGAGDAEAAEAEAAFSGRGVRGKYKVREVVGCPGALSLQIAVRSVHG